MNTIKSASELEIEKSPRKGKPLVVAFAIAFLMVGNLYLLSRINRIQIKSSTLQESTQKDISRLEKQLTFRSTQVTRDLERVQKKLNRAHHDAKKQTMDQFLSRTEELKQKIPQQYRQQQEIALGRIQEIHSDVLQTASKISDVDGNMKKIETDVRVTKSNLNEALLALENSQDGLMAVGDWTASNSKEIGILQEFTARKYFAFNLVKSEEMYRVGDIYIRLKKIKPKRHQYTMEVLADDQRFTKKARQANEPIRFYLGGAKRPHEIVITTVQENRVVGYLSAPKFKPLSN